MPQSGNPGLAPDVFISYASVEADIANKVCNRLEDAGHKCWIAPRDIVAGIPYAEAIVDAIDSCRVFLVILTPSSGASRHVLNEIDRATGKGTHVFPFRLGKFEIPKAMQFYVSTHQWLEASHPPIEQEIEALLENVARLMTGDSGHVERRQPDGTPRRTSVRYLVAGALAGLIAMAALTTVLVNVLTNNDDEQEAVVAVQGEVVAATDRGPVSTATAHQMSATTPEVVIEAVAVQGEFMQPPLGTDRMLTDQPDVVALDAQASAIVDMAAGKSEGGPSAELDDVKVFVPDVQPQILDGGKTGPSGLDGQDATVVEPAAGEIATGPADGKARGAQTKGVERSEDSRGPATSRKAKRENIERSKHHKKDVAAKTAETGQAKEEESPDAGSPTEPGSDPILPQERDKKEELRKKIEERLEFSTD